MNTYYSAAKINLFLQVEGKRPNGYHDLSMVMQSVSLFDRLDIDFEKETYHLDCGGLDLGDINRNIVTRIWRLLKERYHLPGEISVSLKKKIPAGAGLAGGSGNGAAVLRAVEDYFRLNLSKEEIISCASAIGADIAFCRFGGTMLARGIGDILSELPPMPDWDILLYDAGFHVSTPEIFSAYDDIAPEIKPVSVDGMVHAIENNRKEEIPAFLYNGLENVTFTKFPQLRNLSDSLDRISLPHLMSGSGPTVFALASSETADFVMSHMNGGFGKVLRVKPVSQGIYSENEFLKLRL